MCPDETSDFSSQIRNELAVFKMARRIASSMLTRDDLSHCFLGDAVVCAEGLAEYLIAFHSVAPGCIEHSICVSESTSSRAVVYIVACDRGCHPANTLWR